MPYKTKRGRRLQLPAGATNGRQHLVALDGTRATFECQAGHRMVHDYGKGPVSKRVPEAMLRKMAAYWGLGLQSNGTRGHVNGWCQKCQNDWDEADSNPHQKAPATAPAAGPGTNGRGAATTLPAPADAALKGQEGGR